ncbi:hypothetical protein QBC40DRAFT_251561 [Triangularia verruculosa]|uniref:Uncharacterized protein n=1 Tax=Triangularia verruculosa TaxID=2587418 RepID=A0AAN7AYF4_9PEZI|nr:hypothetical protein QBC40DRAFT_251561 [Triangularia verruculosa]
MTPPAKEEEEDPSNTQPATARRHSTPAKPTTTAKTPKSAPAASNNAATQKKKPEPSLLTDFFLGRPSPARLAAMKQRRKSMAADAAHVREELRQEMRAAAVRRLQQPNGVTDRVKAWQKKNAAAMKEAGGPPRAESVASEPTEFAANLPPESVTEEDRERIKWRKKPKKKKPKADKIEVIEDDDDDDDDDDSDGEETEKEQPTKAGPSASKPIPPKDAPKKRIISDDHWMKRRQGRSPPRTGAPRTKAEGSPTPIPKDFLQKTAQNPTVQAKIKDWAARVVPPDPEQLPRVKHYRHKSGATIAVEEDFASMVASEPSFRPKSMSSFDDGIRVKPLNIKKSPKETDGGIRVYPVRKKKEADDDGIRVRPTKSENDDGIRVKPDESKTDASTEAKKKEPVDDGIRVKPVTDDESKRTKKREPADNGIRVKPVTDDEARRPKKKEPAGDGIRIRPADSLKLKTRVKKKAPEDDGIRVRPVESKDDGIRIKPSVKDDGIRVQPSEPSSSEATSRPSRPYHVSAEKMRRAQSKRREELPEDVIEVIEETETDLSVEQPIKRKNSLRNSRRRKSRSPSAPRGGRDSPEVVPVPNWPTVESDEESDRVPPTVLGNKSLAEIPFGYSAFSVLDLPSSANQQKSIPKKPKAQRNPSFKAVPKVFKKVVEGAKEIIQESLEPPRPPPSGNKPASIESWLNNTVDPFVQPSPTAETVTETITDSQISTEPPIRESRETLEPPVKPESRPAAEKRPKEETKEKVKEKDTTNPAHTPSTKRPKTPRSAKSDGSKGKTSSQGEDSDATAKKPKSPVNPDGLKRRRATRGAPVPVKTGGKKPLREILKDAFRGESGGYKLPPTVYPSCEASEYDDEYSEYTESEVSTERPGSSHKRPISDYSSYYSSNYDSNLSSDVSKEPPRKRPPPANGGGNELSTILSEEASTVSATDTMSVISQTTVTQTTATPLTETTQLSRHHSRKGSRKGGSLKRRLTKHSDMISVLSLPDTGQIVPPSRSRSVKSSRSLHRRPSKVDWGRIDELLDEFADDEYFYQRELKTLVDGVIPVLLTHVLRGDSLFGRSEAGRARADAMAKSVVNMGVVLERLKSSHKQVPLENIYHLLTWMDDVSPLYDNYFDVWRLGFQGLIINLAPKLKGMSDNDSLLNALPINEDGDIIGENGERVDVAFLLKRPLIRLKWMTKFLRAAVLVVKTSDTEHLLSVFESLQEKARKRHREENARITDEDARNTDTTRARDLRTLMPLDGVGIEQTRQVAALDVFALDLDHSTGQRLECQVELIHRDKPDVPADKGDVLIREIGNDSRSWLLFPPVPMAYISARLSETDQALVVMIRGTHNGVEWYELLKLSTNSEEQITFWLDVLGSSPMPPITRRRPTSAVMGSTSPKPEDIPVGERKLGSDRPTTPSRYRPRKVAESPPTSPALDADVSPERTPTRATFTQHQAPEERDEARWESPSHDTPRASRPAPNTTPFREDGAPPPPIHRTLSEKSNKLAPPVDLRVAPVKRRGSSPLKHEYHPSDVSSDSSVSEVSDDSESSSSSSDELDEDEVPDTIPGYSIKTVPQVASVETVVSDNSLTPDHSASQVGVPSRAPKKPEEPAQKFVASVSYWSSKKGMWKDIVSGGPTSIVVGPGSMEVHRLSREQSKAYPLQSSGTSEVDITNQDAGSSAPLIALILTPVVMIRRSTALDLEVRSVASPESRLKTESTMYRFRASTQTEASSLYEAVHLSRLNNARYIQLAEEARVRSFGQPQGVMAGGEGSADGDSSARRRSGGGSWFGRKNSYRASTRAPSVSQHSISSTISAGSFLRRLLGGGNNTFNIEESSIDKPPRLSTGTVGYSSSSGDGTSTPPRSVSLSLSGSASRAWSTGLAKPFSPEQPLEIRCHLNVQNNRWLDKGDCILTISRPPPGVRQELSLYHGLEKRIIVTHASKKVGDKPLVLLDAVLGSKCFSLLGSKGVMCSVWEDVRDEEGNVGVAPRMGGVGGRVTKWCFQCRNGQQAEWIMGRAEAGGGFGGSNGVRDSGDGGSLGSGTLVGSGGGSSENVTLVGSGRGSKEDVSGSGSTSRSVSVKGKEKVTRIVGERVRGVRRSVNW